MCCSLLIFDGCVQNCGIYMRTIKEVQWATNMKYVRHICSGAYANNVKCMYTSAYGDNMECSEFI